jgi:hypothetical protein
MSSKSSLPIPMWTTSTHDGVFYAPAEPYFDPTWQLPDIEKPAKWEKSVD